jgi:FKBP-type peptidyl-prolyl cis-trans isomerase
VAGAVAAAASDGKCRVRVVVGEVRHLRISPQLGRRDQPGGPRGVMVFDVELPNLG